MSYKKVPLAKALTFIRGITFKPDDKVEPFSEDSVVCMRTKNIQKSLDDSDILAVPSEFVKRDEQVLEQGDLLISSANSWELVGKVVRVPELDYIATAGGFISILRPNRELVDPDYLYRFISLDDTQHSIRHLGRQTTNISNLDRKRFLELEIPLPPLDVQRQIAAVLEKADTLRNQCQQMEQELNALAQSVFLFNVGDNSDDHTKWPLRTIESLCSSEKGSMRTGPFGSDLKHSEFVEFGYPVIGIDNAVDNEFKWKERRFITEEKYEKLKRYRVKPKDIIITIMGTVGRVAVIPDDIPISISTKHLAVLTINNSIALPEFISDAFRYSTLINRQISKKNKGAIMDGLNLGLIKSLQLRLPPIETQKKYLLQREHFLTVLFDCRTRYQELNNNFNSLMQRAFKGELKLKGVA
ncbi:restriction endonuclease subunit S [Marinomonas communis]|uniref:restriction endonuclease subunit S n=1 Tax=Marinomonas communis TaxID=28254 RepID=UPI001D18962A|nr:restriction endonuclease subunit S [Marinomonas communis]MCC4273915.1 restriction endonuclease subunit S [Marinomonas communis]